MSRWPTDYIGKVLTCDCRVGMAQMPENSVDTIICDPPYGLEFMGKEWDKLWDSRAGTERARMPGTGNIRNAPVYKAGSVAQDWHYLWAKEALRVAKPGAMLLAFGGTRTHHRLMCAIEDAGWCIKDSVLLFWVTGQGFPKSKNFCLDYEQEHCERVQVKPGRWEWQYRDTHEPMSREPPFRDPRANKWYGYGSGLKPSYEIIVLAEKALDGSYSQNAEKWGVAGLWIDGARISCAHPVQKGASTMEFGSQRKGGYEKGTGRMYQTQGRFPANVVFMHHEDCRRVGVKKVAGAGSSTGYPHGPKGHRFKFDPSPNQGNEYQGHGNPDGTETVEAWECVSGGMAMTEQASFDGITATPLDSLEHIIAAIQQISRGLSELKESPCSHNEDRYNLPDYANGDAFGLSRLPSFRVCCQPCRRFYDGLVRVVRDAAQASSQQLSDVQRRAFLFLCSREHNHQNSGLALRPSSDDLYQSDVCLNKRLNNIFAGPSCRFWDETSDRKRGSEHQDSVAPPNSIHGSNISDSSFLRKTLFGSACIDAVFRLFYVLTYRTSSAYLPINIVSCQHKLSSCPIRMLDEQSGLRKTTCIKPHHQNNRNTGLMSTLGHPGAQGYNDMGGASRFFKTFGSDEGCHPECPVRQLDEMSGERPSGTKKPSHKRKTAKGWSGPYADDCGGPAFRSFTGGDTGGASRFFYCAKAPRSERFFLCRDCDAAFPAKTRDQHWHGHYYPGNGRKSWEHLVYHPTQKPLKLLEYLCRLTKTPTGGIVLDPFCGTGTTLVAAEKQGRQFIGMDTEADYVRLAEHRLSIIQPELALEVRK